jgi:hypothetical protein
MNAKALNAAAAAIVALGTATTIWLTEPAPTDKKLALYQAQCHTLHVAVMAEMAKQGIYFKAGEALRPSWVAAIYHKQGKGILTSTHTQSLGWDNFRVLPDGTVSMNAEDYRFFADTWVAAGKKVGVQTNAGINFKSVDAVHTSCTSPTGDQ